MPRDHARAATPTRPPVAVHGNDGSATPALVGHGWILDANNKDALQFKREYHRDHMVAFRQRKKQSLADMKKLHKQLEAQLAQRLAVRRAIILSGCPLGLATLDTTMGSNQDDELLSPAERLVRFQQIYCSLVDEAELRRAQTAILRDELERFVKLKLLLHLELGLLHVADDAEPHTVNASDELRGFFVYFEPQEPPFYFEPFAQRECDDATREGYRKVRVLQDAFNRGELGMREVMCLGWRAQRALERTVLDNGEPGPFISRVRFMRQVQAPAGQAVATLRGLADFAFECLNSTDKYARIQRTKFVSHSLQTLGADTEISLRNAPDPSGSTSVRYLHQLTRVNDTYVAESGLTCERSTVLMLALDSPRHKMLRETVLPRDDIFWITEGTAFVSFVQLDEDTVEIDYGNVCTCISEEQAQYFMIELGAQLLRWENLVMPPRLLSWS
jgi:hypothetical protein